MSETLIASLQKRINDLTDENTGLKSEAKDRRIANGKLKKDLEAATKSVDTLTKERDELKNAAASGPKELTDKIASLEGQILSRDHKEAFAGVKEFKVKGEDGKETEFTLNDGVTVDALWKHLDYKPEGDKPDAAKITGLMGEAAKSASYLFKPKADAATSEAGASKQPLQGQRREPGPGSGTRVLNPANSERPSAAAIVDARFAKTGRTLPGRL